MPNDNSPLHAPAAPRTGRRALPFRLPRSLRGRGRVRRITDSIPSMVGYIDCDRRYRFSNRYYETWLERPLSEITGRRVADVLGPDTYRNVASNLDCAFAGKRVDFDVEVPGVDGTRFVHGSYIPSASRSAVVRRPPPRRC